MREKIFQIVKALSPFDELERTHREFVLNWISSGAEIFRRGKPAVPDPHLVAYGLLVDDQSDHILLVDHKKAGLWLPPGGHVEVDEDPQETARREIHEELGIRPLFTTSNPVFLTVTKTVGHVSEHTDISLWYLLQGSRNDILSFDTEEFSGIHWFPMNAVPYGKSDPHMARCLKKLSGMGATKMS